MTLLNEVVRKQNETYGNRKVVFDICVTRWVENLDGYNMMLHTLPYIIEAFEVIALGFHIDEYPDWTQWDQESRSRASTLIASMGNFQLIITLTIIVNILDIIKGPTIKIQGRSLDLYDVVKHVEAAKLHFKV